MKRTYFFEFLTAGFVLLLPFSIYIHLFIEDTAPSITILGYEYFHFYDDVEAFVWHFFISFIPFCLLVIWFMTNPYWWRYFIFMPLIYWADSLVRNVFVFNDFIEDNLKLFSVVVNISIVCLLILIRFLNGRGQENSKINKLEKNWLAQKDQRLHKIIKKERHLLTSEKKVLAKEEYLKKLYLIKSFLVSSFAHLFSQTNESRPKRKSDIKFAALLTIMPFVLYSYLYIPEEVKELNLLWFTIDSHGFYDVHTFFWFVGSKLGLLLPLILWFLTAKDWWRYAILSSIVLTLYQLFEAFQSAEYADEISFYKAFPLIVVIIGLLIWAAHIIRARTKILELYENITQEIEDILSKIESYTPMFQEKKAEFQDLKKNTKDMKEKQRIDLLVSLREELLKEYALKNRM